MFKRILVPLDGSTNAEKVLPVAITEARLHEAVIVLLRVIAPLRQSLMSSPSVIDQAYQRIEYIAKDYLEKVAAGIKAEGLEVETVIVHGRPAHCTLEVAQDRAIDLIIIGTHGETGALQWRFGSVANKIIRAESSIPVLVVST